MFRNWILVLLITSDMLSGRFFFDSNAQEEQQSGQTDVQKRTATYFAVILYVTAFLGFFRYENLFLMSLMIG